jgi:hypothetical protein
MPVDPLARGGPRRGLMLGELAGPIAQPHPVVSGVAPVGGGDVLTDRGPPDVIELVAHLIGRDPAASEVIDDRAHAGGPQLLDHGGDLGQDLQSLQPFGQPVDPAADERHRGAEQVAAGLGRLEPRLQPGEVAGDVVV